MAHESDIPLAPTPPSWAEGVVAQLDALLCDHAHLEKKAAANAMELLPRGPDSSGRDGEAERVFAWSRLLSSVARDETEHLCQVLRVLERRGTPLPRAHRNPYANDLRTLVRLGAGDLELLDRLLVSALIEARSCERFDALLPALTQERQIAKLYGGLCASERGHYLTFLELAGMVAPAKAVADRWAEFVTREAEIIAHQPPGPRIHSGFPPRG